MGPGILWSDTRSHALMSDLLRRPGFDRRYFADTGTHLQPCNTSLQLYWLKQYQPERLAAARYLFFAKDWIRFRLTGVAALELTDASSSLLNQQSGSWSSVVMNEMGLDELLPLFPAAGPACSGRHAERRGGGADRAARRDAGGRRGAGCLQRRAGLRRGQRRGHLRSSAPPAAPGSSAAARRR